MLPPDYLPPARPRTRRVPQAEPDATLPTVPSATVEEKPSYEVGYGKPPLSTRFKPGQSGNKKERKRGSKNLDTMMLGLLDERIAVNTPSGRRNIPRIEMLIRKQIELAAKGNTRALEQLLRCYDAAKAAATPAQPSAADMVEDVTETDLASMALLREWLIAKHDRDAASPPGGEP